MIAPEAFRVEDVAVVVDSAPDELMIEAARACPSAAIRLIDGGSGAQTADTCGAATTQRYDAEYDGGAAAEETGYSRHGRRRR